MAVELKKKILNWVGERFLQEARIVATDEVSESFRFIDLESPSFRGLKWRPGEKIQINVGDWNVRTYTPLSLDAEAGRLGILAYVHGNGPGSSWAATAKAGDVCRVLGPRASLRFSQDRNDPSAVVIFGDETTIAMAATLKRSLPSSARVRLVFESTVPAEIKRIARDLGLDSVEVVAPSGGAEEPVRAIQRGVTELGGAERCRLVLAGRAKSIHAVRGRLRMLGYPMGRVQTKAYWAEGRTGLD